MMNAPRPFSRSLGILDLERRSFRVGVMGGAMFLLIAWGFWGFRSTVAVYAVSQDARLEVDRAPYPVETPVGGRVVSTILTMGRAVRAGEVLVELDVEAQSLGVSEARAHVSGLSPQIARVEAEIEEQERGRRDEQGASAAAIAQAQASYDEARAAADLAADSEDRMTRLAAQGLIGPADLVRAQSETRQKRAAADALRLVSPRIEAEQQHKDTGHRIEIERLKRVAAGLRAQVGTGAAIVQRLQHEGELRRITAPVSGTLAEVATLRVGRVLQPGDTVATVVPSGALHIVAAFLPADAFGRIHSGQSARLRLQGFPFTQYGSVHAVVSNVARELRDGRVRVELALSQATTSVPMQHGLPGTVEVEIEQISPVALLLRAAGRRMDPHSEASPPPVQPR